ncbi:MAG: TonB-dependent receptor plug domain-containing protein [Opitutaceae bacterium]|nr:TonB-dependent receptor plug domain-containing protein [Opitutaceae bacterium]
MNPHRTNLTTLITPWLALLAISHAIAAEPARTTPPATATPPVTNAAPGADANQDDVLELSPFNVVTTRDVGYQAENTLAGSRLNTQLRDTAGSISVFTKEFLDDVGITDIKELVQYSVNSEMNTNENQAGSNQNPIVNAQSLTPPILIRGLAASLGMDYFTSITPTDPYRVGRYEDSRGPNSILFGVGSPGGLLNQSSKTASTGRDSATVRYGTGSFDRHRLELDANKVLRKDKLAVSMAALHQENGGWRAFDFQDKKRIFGSVTYRPLRQLSLTVMGETGRDRTAVIRATVEADQALAWYDNREAFGVNAVTFAPGTTAPTAAMQAVGVTTRDSTRTGNNHRVTFIENDGTIFDASGAFLTGSYNNSAVRGPDGTPGVTGSTLRVNDATLYPADRDINAAGPGMFRDQKLKNFTVTADWQATRNLAFNLAYNYQDTRAVVNLMTGADPTLRGEANRTLGVNGPANPYAGRLYFDGNWRRDVHVGDVRETRLTGSYTLDTKSKWFGRHRIAAMVSRAKQFDTRANSWLALAGRPFNAAGNNVNNRITVRNYITEGSYATYRVGDWRKLPETVTFGGQTYELVFANELGDGANNGGGDQESTTKLGVIQSHFLGGKLVTTFGYREDEIEVIELGYYQDPLIGDVVDRDRSKGKLTSATGHTATAGAVYHVFDWLSVIANRSSNQGVPSFVRKIFPDGNLAPPSKGEGADYGLGFDLLGGRLNAKAVYFTSKEQGRITTTGFGGASGRNTRVMDAFAGVLVGTGLPFSPSQWDPIYSQYTPPATAASSDFDSEGYEARVTANLTRNWRLVANYSYTDSIRKNVAAEIAAWYGLKSAEGGKAVVQGVSQDATGRFVVDSNAFETGGAVAKWLELGRLNPEADVSTLTTSNGQTIAQEIFNLTDNMNDDKEQEEKRWGVRPHKISLFTAYDFREGALKGFTIGGGWRWRSANVIGADANGSEITGKVITATDLMMAYTRKFERLPGRVRFQINISNVLDDTDIIPVRLSTSASAPNGFMLPGGRGMAYSRYDLVAPRDIRFTTTWSF